MSPLVSICGMPALDISEEKLFDACLSLRLEQQYLPAHFCPSANLVSWKHPHHPHPPSDTPQASRFLKLVHSNLCGPIPILTPHNKCYFIIFLDDHTNVLNLQLLASKDQALDAWRLVQAQWENQSGLRVKVFRSDNGGEFLNAAFTAELEKAGIIHQLLAPYAHQQNGKAERVIHMIEGRMYAMLDHACLPRSLWGEAALCAAYLFNCTESRALPTGKTPYEMLHSAKPDISHLWVFGVRCFVRIPVELQEKLGPQSRTAIFMGYPPGVKAWRCQDSTTGAFFNSRDVIFNESFSDCEFPTSDSDDEDNNDNTAPPPPASVVVPPPPALVAPIIPHASRLHAPPAAPISPPRERHSSRSLVLTK